MTPDIEIDKMAADFIEDKLFAAAAMRIDHEDSGYKYYYSKGFPLAFITLRSTPHCVGFFNVYFIRSVSSF